MPIHSFVPYFGGHLNVTHGEVPIFLESPQPVQEKKLHFDTLFRNY